MKLAIISDTHDNLANIAKALKYINEWGAETLLHCGDVCAPGTLVEIAKQYTKPIHLSLGNVDGDPFNMLRLVHEGKAANVTIYQNVGELELGGKKIAINHFPNVAASLAKTGDYDLVFYGHNHKPWEETVGTTRLVNPGNAANIFFAPTFATYDTATDELKLIQVNEI